ncbi:MAG: DUF1343 domain-containing protein [Candidatus Neomarinimicrobiota bacterium]
MKKLNSLIIVLLTILVASCSMQTGLDVAAKNNFPMFDGKKIGIVTNHTALNKEGVHLVDLIHDSGNIVQAIYAPEHGFRGDAQAGEHFSDNVDSKTGAIIYSIYGRTRKPSKAMLKDVDILVFDIQDIGARFYTYISTMGEIMEAGAENNIPVYILDRPNPIGRMAEGPIIEQDLYSFVGAYPIPVRHGMTVGELALMIKDQEWINKAKDLDLHIVKTEGWDPQKPYSVTKQNWVNPSPNIRNINEALVYPGTCFFEATNFSEGRGSDKPFEWVGAPFVNSEELITTLEAKNIAGVELQAVSFVPTVPADKPFKPKFNEKECHGIAITVTDPMNYKALEFGMHLIEVLLELYPDDFKISRPEWMHKLWGNRLAYEMFMQGDSANDIIKTYENELTQFKNIREKYLLY